MSDNLKATVDFAEHLQAVVNLEALEHITHDLDSELADSQRVMAEIKAMFNSIPNGVFDVPTDESLRLEDRSKFLVASAPKLLLKDMVQNTVEGGVDDVVAAMKLYADEMKKKFSETEPQSGNVHLQQNKIDNLDLQQYAASLNQLSQRLGNIKLNKNAVDNRNMDLEVKLGQLCQDVNMFTQMVQAKTTLGECNQSEARMPHSNVAFPYDNMINQLVMELNELTCMLRNRN